VINGHSNGFVVSRLTSKGIEVHFGGQAIVKVLKNIFLKMFIGNIYVIFISFLVHQFAPNLTKLL